MTPRLIHVVALLAIVGCHNAASTAATPTPAPTSPSARPGAATSGTGTPAPMTRDVFVSTGNSFRPARGDSALRAFVPDVAAQESGGECSMTRTTGSGATMVIAAFPAKVKALMQVTLAFDSAGRLVRYSERRGMVDLSGAKGMQGAQFDSLVRAQEAKMRSTTISMDYAVDQAMVMNRGAGMPITAIMGTVREIERLDKLGPPSARLERVRKLCGV